ncbi:MAG TPA: 50S ribosomal protein L25/general stress protein Ctc [Micromonosporaceae bacterium]|nr:50S ribosomal protein L25/general stress protein Ctc [Micromonosporaceae bacterium]
MSEVKISAEPRTEFGKGGARRTRRAGRVPAVLYGHGEKPRHISLPARELASAIRHGGMTQVFNIDISDGTTALALPKAIQRDPLKDTFEHVDLLIVRRGEMVTVDIPVHVIGEAGRDTLVMVESSNISVVADATRLPDHVEASIEGLTAGSNVTAGEVKLPEGVQLASDAEMVLVIVAASPTAEAMEADGVGEAPVAAPAAPTEEEEAAPAEEPAEA